MDVQRNLERVACSQYTPPTVESLLIQLKVAQAAFKKAKTPIEMVNAQEVIDALADPNANTPAAPEWTHIPSPLCAASTGMRMMGWQIRPEVIDLLLGAKADATIQFANPDMPQGSTLTPEGWAMRAVGKERGAEVAAIFERHETFGALASRMVTMQRIDEAEVDGLTNRIAEGELTEAQAKDHLRAVEEASAQAEREKAASEERAIAKAFIAAHGAGGPQVDVLMKAGGLSPEPAVGDELPRGSMVVFGGRVQLTGIKSDASLNGRFGRTVSWNEGGKRRFGVRLEGSGKMLSLKPRNLMPYDAHPFPGEFTASSSEVCAALQAELTASGHSAKVVDWTPLAASMSDVVHLLWIAILSQHTDELIYVQRTPETAPFFLCHREIVCPTLPHLSDSRSLATFPWLVISTSITALPTAWAGCCEQNFIVRLCLHCCQPTRQCTICLEEKPVAKNPSQLPCVHFLCAECLRKQFPVSGYMAANNERDSNGLTCPTCKLHFPNHRVLDSPGLDGGVAITETFTLPK